MKRTVVLMFACVWINVHYMLSQNDMNTVTLGGRSVSGYNTDYNKILAEALYLQLKTDSLNRLARDKRILINEIPDEAMKNQLVDEIVIHEREAKSYQVQADRMFERAREIKESQVSGPGQNDSLLMLYKTVNGIKVYQYKLTNETKSQETFDHQNTLSGYEVFGKTPQSALQNTDKQIVRQDVFEILDHSPYNHDKPFASGLESLPGLTYRIQLGVFSGQVPFDAFLGINPVCVVREQEDTIFKYYAGLFFSLANVTTALEKIRNIGFPDAFIVAFLDGTPISTEKAREIEYAQYKL